MDIYEIENANAVVGSFGGQLPQNIILKLQETGGANVLGTNPQDIDKAEDRQVCIDLEIYTKSNSVLILFRNSLKFLTASASTSLSGRSSLRLKKRNVSRKKSDTQFLSDPRMCCRVLR